MDHGERADPRGDPPGDHVGLVEAARDVPAAVQRDGNEDLRLVQQALGALGVDQAIGEELAQRFAKVQMVPLGWWDNGIRHITNSKRPVAKPADLKGLKIRTPPDPMTIDIFQALGAGTEQISFGELYIALQQGVVDGQENPLTNIASSKLFEVNKFISLSGHKWESSPFLMSQITWTRLSPADKEIIKTAAKEAGDLQRKLFAENEAKFNAQFRADPKLAVNEVDKPAFREASSKVVDTWRAKPFGPFVDQLVKAAKV